MKPLRFQELQLFHQTLISLLLHHLCCLSYFLYFLSHVRIAEEIAEETSAPLISLLCFKLILLCSCLILSDMFTRSNIQLLIFFLYVEKKRRIGSILTFLTVVHQFPSRLSWGDVSSWSFFRPNLRLPSIPSLLLYTRHVSKQIWIEREFCEQINENESR